MRTSPQNARRCGCWGQQLRPPPDRARALLGVHPGDTKTHAHTKPAHERLLPGNSPNTHRPGAPPTGDWSDANGSRGRPPGRHPGCDGDRFYKALCWGNQAKHRQAPSSLTTPRTSMKVSTQDPTRTSTDAHPGLCPSPPGCSPDRGDTGTKGTDGSAPVHPHGSPRHQPCGAAGGVRTMETRGARGRLTMS